MPEIRIGEIDIDVTYKDIKNVHLGVYPPNGQVKISAPLRTAPDVLRVFAISKISWIKKQQLKFRAQEREPVKDFVSRESHYFLGKRYLLKVIEHDAPPRIEIKHDTLTIFVRPATEAKKRQMILEEWYRRNLKEIASAIIAKHEKRLKVSVNQLGVKKMKTRWGTCNGKAGRIWLNLELAKKSREFIEYIIVHEMIHILERRHNEIFIAYMDRFLPEWRFTGKSVILGILKSIKRFFPLPFCLISY